MNKIIGELLADNLVRNGSDLSFEGKLLYLDVNNASIGINTFTPSATASMDIVGPLQINSILIDDNTLTNSDSTGFIFDLGLNDLSLTGSKIVDLQDPTDPQDAATLQYVEDQLSADFKDRIIDGDSELVITETGSDTSLNFLTDSGTNDVFDFRSSLATISVPTTISNTLTTISTAILVDVYVDSGSISTTPGSNSTLSIASDNGVVMLNGEVKFSATTSDKVLYTDGNNSVVSNPSLTFDGNSLILAGQFTCDQIVIDNNTISSTVDTNIISQQVARITGVNGVDIISGDDTNVLIKTPLSGIVTIDATTALTIPNGTTAQRPVAPEQGAIRFNQNLNYPEVWDGFEWNQFSSDFVDITLQTIVPDGVSSIYVLDKEATSESILLSINGVLQTPDVAYGVSGTNVTFVAVPLISDIIDIRFLASIAEVASITDSLGTTLVKAIAGEIHLDVSGTRRMTLLNDRIEVSSIILPSVDDLYSIGLPNREFVNVHSTVLSTDYIGDNIYPIGTVIVIGGLNEVTQSLVYADPTIAGVITVDDGTTNTTVAQSGRTLCLVSGIVNKGDLLTSSNTAGHATVLLPGDYEPGIVIGKALESSAGPTNIIKIMISLF